MVVCGVRVYLLGEKVSRAAFDQRQYRAYAGVQTFYRNMINKVWRLLVMSQVTNVLMVPFISDWMATS